MVCVDKFMMAVGDIYPCVGRYHKIKYEKLVSTEEKKRMIQAYRFFFQV